MTTNPIYEPKGRAREYAPLALNLYRGCAHGCAYCYAPSATRKDRDTFTNAVQPRTGVIEAAAKQLGQASLLKDGLELPVLLCFTCDAYQPADDEHRLARQAIELLHAHGYPVHVLTKGATRARRDFDLLGANDADAFAVTLTFADEAQSLAWEPAADTPGARIDALEHAHELGITTWASLEPVIDPEQSLRLIWAAAPFVDLFKIGRWNYDKRANEIDWRDFAQRAVALLEELGKDYYLKDDLRCFLDAA